MTGLTTWQSDDQCPACGAYLIEISGPAGGRVIQQCRACAWSVTWTVSRVVLTAVQSGCLADMVADAIAYRCAAATGFQHCRQSPAEDCPEHSPDHAQIEAYRQLAADLASAGGGQ
jgi:hypothetical protein